MATLLLAASCCAQAVTIVLPPADDATLYEQSTGELANGSGSHLFAGLTLANSARRSVVRFAVADAIPAGSLILATELRMNVSRSIFTEPLPVTLHRMQSSWHEGSSVAPSAEGSGTMATIGDVTWLHRQYPTVSWNTAGGDHDPAPTGTSNTPQSGPTHWASSPPMVACVQDWLDDPATNFGWLLRTDEAISRAVRRFDSRQHPSPTMRPALEITYLPLGSWAVVGPGCGAPAPTLTLSGSFGPGGAMVLQLQSTPNLLAISFLGLTLARPARALTPGCLIHIAPTSLLTTDLMQLDVAGQLALPIAIPATPVFTGLPIAAQSGVLDPGLPSGFGLSNATLALLL